MKLKTLLIVILALAALAGAAYLLNRPERNAATTDERVGQPLVALPLVERAARIELAENGQTVRLRQSGPSGPWVVESYHDLPADFSKLTSLVGSLTSAKIERLATQNPERLARLGFSDTRVALADAEGKPLVTLTLGKNAEGGGRFVKIDDTPKGYVSPVNVWLDATARNWADTTLLSFAQDDIASVTVAFPTGEPLTLTRADKAAAFTTASIPAGQQVKASAVTSLLGNFSALRFTETSAPDAPEVAGAREHGRTVTLKTFNGKTYTVTVGRQPERAVVKPDVAKPAPALAAELVANVAKPAPIAKEPEKAGPAALVGALTEKIPAGPVFVFVTSSETAAPVNTMMAKRAFQIGEYTLNAIPTQAADFFEPVPEKK